MRLQRSYDDDVKQHGERGSTCHQEREQTGDNTLIDDYTSHPPGARWRLLWSSIFWVFNGDVQVHSLVQEKMEGISIEVLWYAFVGDFIMNLFLNIPMQVNEDDLTDVQAVIDGPPGTPYQGASQ